MKKYNYKGGVGINTYTEYISTKENKSIKDKDLTILKNKDKIKQASSKYYLEYNPNINNPYKTNSSFNNPKDYTFYKIENINKKDVLDNYKSTNNGIYIKDFSIKKGGSKFTNEDISIVIDDNILGLNLIEEIKSYKKKFDINYDEINKKYEALTDDEKNKFKNPENYYFYIKVLQFDEKDIFKDYDLLSPNFLTHIQFLYLKMLPVLSDNDYKEDYKIVIQCDEDDIYKIKDLGTYKTPSKTTLDFTHSYYNVAIISAYEQLYIRNIQNLKKFIETQEKYINDLSLRDKIIINDYTKFSCFILYAQYANAITRHPNKAEYAQINGNAIRDFYINVENFYRPHKHFHFGDSYYSQIIDIIGIDEFKEKIKNNDDIIKSKIINDAIRRDFDSINTIDDYWNFLQNYNIDRREPQSESIFSDLIDTTWQKILIKFMKDVNDIVENAPSTESEIYCYRGCDSDYIWLNEDQGLDIDYTKERQAFLFKDENTFISVRPGSFSINFDISKQYAKNVMYRVTIQSGIKVLYIPSLSYDSKEFEILHGGFGVFNMRGNNLKHFNNKNNKFGILSHLNEGFNSVDVVFSGYNKSIEYHFETIKRSEEQVLTEIVQPSITMERQFSSFTAGGGKKKKKLNKF